MPEPVSKHYSTGLTKNVNVLLHFYLPLNSGILHLQLHCYRYLQIGDVTVIKFAPVLPCLILPCLKRLIPGNRVMEGLYKDAVRATLLLKKPSCLALVIQNRLHIMVVSVLLWVMWQVPEYCQ